MLSNFAEIYLPFTVAFKILAFSAFFLRFLKIQTDCINITSFCTTQIPAAAHRILWQDFVQLPQFLFRLWIFPRSCKPLQFAKTPPLFFRSRCFSACFSGMTRPRFPGLILIVSPAAGHILPKGALCCFSPFSTAAAPGYTPLFSGSAPSPTGANHRAISIYNVIYKYPI